MVIDWENRISWEFVVASAFNKILGNDYANIIQKNADRIRYSDDDEAFCGLFTDRHCHGDIIASVIEEIKKSITYIQAYHACRPENIESYYKDGIISLNPIEIQQLFYRRFCNFSSEDIKRAIAGVSIDTRINVAYVALDDRFLIKHCGHYLIYGSEYLNCLAVHLPKGGEHTRDVLKMYGKATMFVCKIPANHIKDSDWEYLVSRMIAEYAYALAHSTNKLAVNKLDFTIFVNGKIPPEAICTHYHPERIQYPYKYRKIWNDKYQKYEFSIADY